MPRVTGTLTQTAVGLPIVNVADVAGAETAGSASAAVAAIPDATASVRGLATAAQVSKLNGIAAGAQANPAFGSTAGTVAEGNDARLTQVTTDLAPRAVRVFATCAEARANLTAQMSRIEVAGRGTFVLDGTSVAVDTGDENTTAIKRSAIDGSWVWEGAKLAVLTPAGTVAVSSVGQVNGPGTSPGEYVFLPSGTSDDWARLNALLVAGWRRVRFTGGIYYATTPLLIPSGTEIILDRNTDIRCTLATASPFDSCFSCTPPVAAATATLNAAVAVGAKTIQLQTPTDPTKLVAGNFLILYNSAHPAAISLFRIDKVTGTSAPYTVTLDRTVKRGRLITDTVGIYESVTEGINIHGNGAHVSGVMNRAQEMSIAWNCHTYDLIVTDTYGACAGPIASFDIPSHGCSFERCRIEYATANSAQPGFYLESNERSWIDGCVSINADYGAQLVDCTDCWIENTQGTGGTFAILVGAGTADLTQGCVDCSVVGCTVTSVLRGVSVLHGSIRTRITDTKGYGCEIAFQVAAPSINTMISACSTEYSSGFGLNITGTDCAISGFVSKNDARGLLLGSSAGGSGANTRAWCSDFTFSGSTSGMIPIECCAGSSLTLRGADITHASIVGIHGSATGTKMSLRDVRLTGPAAADAIYTGGVGSVLSCSRVKCLSGYGGAGHYGITRTIAGGSIWLGPENDFSVCTAAYHAACDVSVRVITLTGTAPVSFAFADLKATDAIAISRRTIAGTAGNVTYTATPGTGLSVVSDQATDTGTVLVVIG